MYFVYKVVKYNKECPSVHYLTIYYDLQALGVPLPWAAGPTGPGGHNKWFNSPLAGFFFITASEKTAFTRKDSNEDMVTELIAHLTERKPAVTRQSFGFTPEELIVRTQFEGQRVRETE